MISMSSPSREIRQQRERIKGIKGGFEKAFKRAASRVATQGRTEISKGIRQNINIKASDLKPVLQLGRHKQGASITLRESQRISLRYFGATQNKKGVTYKMNKGKGRSFIEGAFQGPRPGAMKVSWKGNVFKRVGKSRLPIQKLMGASAWGVFVVRGMYKPTEKDLSSKFNDRLRHEVGYLIEKGRSRSG
jgi:hypothetical protein